MKFGKTPHAVEVNVPSRSVLFQTLRDKLSKGTGFTLATLNLDHLTKLPKDPDFLTAYRAHDLVVADGRPIVWLSQLGAQPVELMPGSDLIAPLCQLCADMQVSVALIGSTETSLNRAAAALTDRCPGLRISYIHAPKFGFDPQGDEASGIAKALKDSNAGLCFVALGAPKQEVFAACAAQIAPQVGFVSIGAGLDFLAGQQKRAPLIMRKLALEWLWRLAQSPRRMLPRYAQCFAILPGLLIQALKQR